MTCFISFAFTAARTSVLPGAKHDADAPGFCALPQQIQDPRDDVVEIDLLPLDVVRVGEVDQVADDGGDVGDFLAQPARPSPARPGYAPAFSGPRGSCR